jgi:hypothetical protein
MSDPQTTTASVSWLSALTPLVSFVLGFITAVFAEPVRQRFFRPELELSFSGREDTITKTATVGGSQAVYVRVQVQNKKPKLARACRAYLVNVETKSTTGGFEPTAYVDSIQLAWSCQVLGHERDPIDIPNGVSQYIDVVATSNISSHFAIQIAPLPVRYNVLQSPNAQTYRYTIQVAGDGAEPKTLKLVFVWKGKWDDVEAYEDKGDA